MVAPRLPRGELSDARLSADRTYPGATPEGVLDLVGNVWQWTDAFEDAHTTRALVRGGSRYVLSQGIMAGRVCGGHPCNTTMGHSVPGTLSYWYFPPVVPNHFNTAMPPYSASPLTLHNTLLLLNGASDRAATIGFRCAWDR